MTFPQSARVQQAMSSQMYKDFFRTVPPGNWQAEVMADIIELFNWTYVAAVGLDDSYGLNGISALDRKSTRLNSSHDYESRMPSSA